MTVSAESAGSKFAGKSEEMIRSASVRSTPFEDGALEVVYAKSREGATTKTLEIALRRNALVRTLDVVVTAATASIVAAGVAGQIRTTSKGGGDTSIVV